MITALDPGTGVTSMLPPVPGHAADSAPAWAAERPLSVTYTVVAAGLVGCWRSPHAAPMSALRFASPSTPT